MTIEIKAAFDRVLAHGASVENPDNPMELYISVMSVRNYYIEKLIKSIEKIGDNKIISNLFVDLAFNGDISRWDVYRAEMCSINLQT